MTHEEDIQKYFDEYIVPKDLDVYGFLKHYRDLMSWSEPSLISIGTTDAMIVLEKYYRQKIVDEIENYRVVTCRCDSELKPNCEALLDVIEIIQDTTHLVEPSNSTIDITGTNLLQ